MNFDALTRSGKSGFQWKAETDALAEAGVDADIGDGAASPASSVRAPDGLTVERSAAADEAVVVVSFPSRCGKHLTTAEVSLLCAMLNGASNREMAQRRGTSVKTVSNQVSSLLAKMGAASRHELSARWFELLSA